MVKDLRNIVNFTLKSENGELNATLATFSILILLADDSTSSIARRTPSAGFTRIFVRPFGAFLRGLWFLDKSALIWKPGN